MNPNYKRYILNLFYNALSSFLPIFILQFIILPKVNQSIGATQYGLFLSVIGIINIVPSRAGNVLNNIRLVTSFDYSKKGLNGDFSLLSIIYCLGSALLAILFLVLLFNKNGDYSNFSLFVFLCILVFFHEYASVEFLLVLDYSKILISQLLLSLGYYLGYLVFKHINYWEIIYITAYLLCDIYIILNSHILSERKTKTELFQTTAKKSLILLIASIIGNSLGYIDRLLIYPLLGGKELSIYYVSTLVGKIISTAIGPVSSLLLTYLSKSGKLSSKKFSILIITSILFGIAGYFASIIIGKPLLQKLYPDLFSEAWNYVFINSFTSIVGMLFSLVNPIVLRFCDTKWQLLLSGLNLLLYLIITLPLLYKFNLIGFCYGVSIVTVINFTITLVLAKIQIRNDNK